ncbi:MAG: M50 family metallopeptidase [Bacteroidota bacterium]
MKSNILYRILAILGIYLGLRYFGGEIGAKILYPITLLVTFLHEFGHALGALITGGSVNRVQISQDGSGFTETVGGARAVILMGGYLGSAILGNLLFYLGAKKEKSSEIVLYILAILMLFTGIIWFNSIFTTVVLIVFAVVLFFIANKTSFSREVLMFLGLATIIYIIQDFNVGPRSDLQKYAELFVVIPSTVWMYIWLAVAVILSFFNLRMIFRSARRAA